MPAEIVSLEGERPLIVATELGFSYAPVSLPFLGPKREPVHAVRNVSFELRAGETLGILGESGCGKSTLTGLICGDLMPAAGSLTLDGQPLSNFIRPNRRPLARRMQVVAQDPLASFDPRQPIGEQLVEALTIHKIGTRAERRNKVLAACAAVSLPATSIEKYPHQLSGGQRQRMSIARALIVEPEILICDEPVSALDVSIQAQVLNLLVDLQRSRGLAMLFVSHDVRVVRHMAHRIAVMQAGVFVETGDAEQVLTAPSHPYTAKLLAAVPKGRRAAPAKQEFA